MSLCPFIDEKPSSPRVRCACSQIIRSRVAQDNTVLFLGQHFLNLSSLNREHLFLTAPLAASRWLPVPPLEEGLGVFPPLVRAVPLLHGHLSPGDLLPGVCAEDRAWLCL